MKLFTADFHGVLEKGNGQLTLDVTNRILEQYGYRERLSKEKAKEYYGFKWYEYFEKILPPTTTTKQHKELQSACLKYYEGNRKAYAKHIQANDFVIEVLGKIKDSVHDQIILSNTRPDNLLWFLNIIGIKKYFSKAKVIGVNAHEDIMEKKDALAEYLDGRDYDEIVIIGDSESDLQLKKVAGGVTYFYHYPYLKLNKAIQADFIITDLREVLNEL